jgi:hypothetical protein
MAEQYIMAGVHGGEDLFTSWWQGSKDRKGKGPNNPFKDTP